MTGWWVAGKVVGADRRPVEGATVSLVDGPGEFRDIAALSGEDGSFAFSGLVEGTYRVAALAPDGGRAEGWFRSSPSAVEEVVLTIGS